MRQRYASAPSSRVLSRLQASPEYAAAWRMHAHASAENGDHVKAAQSFTVAARLYGEQGDAEHKASCARNARRCLGAGRK